MQRIRWRGDELNSIAVKVVALMGQGASILQATRAAQDLLPEERRRPLKGAHNIPSELVALIESRLSDGTAVEVPPPTIEESIAALAKSVKRIEVFLEQLLQGQIGTLTLPSTIPISVPPLPQTIERIRKRTVLIVGCNAEQFEAAQREWGAHFEMTYLHHWRPTMKGRLKTVDYCIGVTKFMNHATEAVIKAHSKRYIRVGGPGNDLRSALRSLHALAQN